MPEKLLDKLCPADYLTFYQHLQPAISQAKRGGCGKQLLSVRLLQILHTHEYRPNHVID
jgi:hypothetical protein